MIEILKALADETRLRIISIILEGPLCVCEVEECLQLTQSNVSRHLTTLKRAGILESYKVAQWAYYKISQDFIDYHGELYNYLLKTLRNSPSYEKDYAHYKVCKGMHLCEMKNNKKEEGEKNE